MSGDRDGGRLTSRDVASLAGVSQTTVSRVLADAPNVSSSTRAHVLAVLERTGYRPNTAARAMRTRTTGNLGVVVARVSNPFYPQLLECLSEAIASRGRLMSLWISDEGEEPAALDSIARGAVDGVLYTSATPDSQSLQLAISRRAPVVLLNRTLAGVECDQVASDNRGGAAAAARHLAEGGRRRIALVGGPAEVSTGAEREQGFLAELERLGLAPDPLHLARGDFTHAEGERSMRELLARDPAPDAVFCVNDVIALGAIDAARAAEVAVPEELWVVGFDDIEISSWTSYSLTTVRQPSEEMAARAVDLLLERIDGGAPAEPRRLQLPGELLVRGSTGG